MLFRSDKCVIKENQLIDASHNGFYATFNVMAEESGFYSFTSNVGTASAGVTLTLGYLDGNSDYSVSKTLDILNTGGFTDTRNYTWTFELEANKVYDFKLMGNTPAGYCVNLYQMLIEKAEGGEEEEETTENIVLIGGSESAEVKSTNILTHNK